MNFKREKPKLNFCIFIYFLKILLFLSCPMPITHKRYLHTVSIICRKYVSSKIHPTHKNFPFHHYNSKYIFIYSHAHRKNVHQLSTTQSIPQPAATHHQSLIKHLHSPLPTSNIFLRNHRHSLPHRIFPHPNSVTY